ncbi:MAG: hypothetical protein V3R73_00915 [Sphingomonadales bacterium]
MPIKSSLVGAAVLAALAVSPTQAFEDNHPTIGARITIPFGGPIERTGNRGPRFDLAMSLRQGPSLKAQRYGTRQLNLSLASIPLDGNGFQRMSLMGLRPNEVRRMLNAAGDGDGFSINNTVMIGLGVVVVAGFAVIIATSGRSELAKRCAAAAPPKPAECN